MRATVAWLLLILAGMFETGWAMGLEYSEGLTKPKPVLATLIALIISMVLLAKAVETLPIGTAYAVWTGIGASTTAVLGIHLFNETMSFGRLFFICMIVIGVLGLQIVTAS
jgi:quaternary ammonium compound-resistance protein SugE